LPFACGNALELLGLLGWTRKTQAEKWTRDAKIKDIFSKSTF
jgi:alkylation response protein AidB-like acyl-CoA dehydrogenase